MMADVQANQEGTPSVSAGDRAKKKKACAECRQQKVCRASLPRSLN